MRVVLLTALTVCAGAAWGQRQTLTVEPGRSQVHFNLADPLHAVNGTFRVESGSFTFDRRDGSMGGRILVDATSGHSGSEARDRRMTEDELKAGDYRQVTFAARKFTGTLAAAGDSEIKVDGVFTLVGTPHEIAVPMKVHLEGRQCRATGTFTVPYVKWGMKDPSKFVLRVGKEVEIQMVLVGTVD